jgi:hypothetical protein
MKPRTAYLTRCLPVLVVSLFLSLILNGEDPPIRRTMSSVVRRSNHHLVYEVPNSE